MLTHLKRHHNKNPFVFLLVIHSLFLAVIFFAYLRCNDELEKQAKSQEVIAAAATLSKSFYDAGLAIGAYSLTKNEMFSERYEKLSSQIPASLETIRALIKDQPISKAHLAEIDLIVGQGLTQLSKIKSAINTDQISPFSGNNTEVRGLYKQIKYTTDQLQNKLDDLSKIEQEIYQTRPQHRMVLQALLLFMLVAYGSYNLATQYRLIKVVSMFTHHISNN